MRAHGSVGLERTGGQMGRKPQGHIQKLLDMTDFMRRRSPPTADQLSMGDQYYLYLKESYRYTSIDDQRDLISSSIGEWNDHVECYLNPLFGEREHLIAW